MAIKRTRGGAVAMSRLSIAAEDIYSERALEKWRKDVRLPKRRSSLLSADGLLYGCLAPR